MRAEVFDARPGARLSWYVRVIWDRMSLAVCLLLALLLLWVGLRWHVIMPLQKQEQASGQAVLEAAQAFRQAANSPTLVKNVSSEPDISQRFLAFLPVLSERDNQLQRVHAQLRQHGLTLGRMDFQQGPVVGLNADRLSVRFTLQGGYPALRAALQDLLKQNGNLAITRLGLEQPEASPGLLALTLESSLYYRVPGSGATP